MGGRQGNVDDAGRLDFRRTEAEETFMLPRITPLIFVAVGLALATDAHAHPGHGTDTKGVGLLHFLLAPSHGGTAALLVVVVLGIAVVARMYGRRQG